MADNDLYNMFGDGAPSKKEASASRFLAGMNITKSQLIKVPTVDGETMDLPSVTYVRLLEVQIKELRQVVKQQENMIQRLSRAISKNTNDIQTLKEKNKD